MTIKLNLNPFYLEVPAVNSIMLLHTFGAFFGLALTWILFRKGSLQPFEKEKFDRQAGLFSMLGKADGLVGFSEVAAGLGFNLASGIVQLEIQVQTLN